MTNRERVFWLFTGAEIVLLLILLSSAAAAAGCGNRNMIGLWDVWASPAIRATDVPSHSVCFIYIWEDENDQLYVQADPERLQSCKQLGAVRADVTGGSFTIQPSCFVRGELTFAGTATAVMMNGQMSLDRNSMSGRHPDQNSRDRNDTGQSSVSI